MFSYIILNKNELMEFIFNLFQNTALHTAVEKGNSDIIKLLLNHKSIDTNVLNGIYFYI